ncbi:MAG TPA: UbiA family prenyltransferase [Desulfuromonadaceae bacterium]|jgi:protoheme IX farnesyltransferase
MIRALYRLFRLRLALLNGVAGIGGYLLFPAKVETAPLLATFCGVALLAAGGSALNQVLEQDLDRLMERTRMRPLPRKDLTPQAALALGAATILAGLAHLWLIGGLLPPFLGGLALIWYLVVYTPLKRRTCFALPIGALCGTLPPIIGWCLAGGAAADYRIVLLAGLMYLWQVPHFWLFQRRYALDYQRAGLPLLRINGPDTALSGLFALWIIALAAAAMLLPALGVLERYMGLWYALLPLPLIVMLLIRSEKALFSYLNLFPLFVTLILSVQ